MSGHGQDVARQFLGTRPQTKFKHNDTRVAVRYLWSLLYRAVRREHARLDQALRSVSALARRIGGLSTELDTLRVRVERLERLERERIERRERA